MFGRLFGVLDTTNCPPENILTNISGNNTKACHLCGAPGRKGQQFHAVVQAALPSGPCKSSDSVVFKDVSSRKRWHIPRVLQQGNSSCMGKLHIF